MDAAFEPGSYEAARLEADAEMAELATAFRTYLAQEVAPRITSHLLDCGVLPEGAQVAYKLQD